MSLHTLRPEDEARECPHCDCGRVTTLWGGDWECEDCHGTCQLGNPDAEKVIGIREMSTVLVGKAKVPVPGGFCWRDERLRHKGKLRGWSVLSYPSEDDALATARAVLSP